MFVSQNQGLAIRIQMFKEAQQLIESISVFSEVSVACALPFQRRGCVGSVVVSEQEGDNQYLLAHPMQYYVELFHAKRRQKFPVEHPVLQRVSDDASCARLQS